MDNLYISAGIVACVFLLAKFIEIRFISKSSENEATDSKPMKTAFRDAAIVFVSYILGNFIVTQFNESPVVLGSKPDVFTGAPGF
jgi:hypothetical protein